MYGERRGIYRVLVGKPDEEQPVRKPCRRWKDNIKVYLKEVGWGPWTGLIWLRIGTRSGLL